MSYDMQCHKPSMIPFHPVEHTSQFPEHSKAMLQEAKHTTHEPIGFLMQCVHTVLYNDVKWLWTTLPWEATTSTSSDTTLLPIKENSRCFHIQLHQILLIMKINYISSCLFMYVPGVFSILGLDSLDIYTYFRGSM